MDILRDLQNMMGAGGASRGMGAGFGRGAGGAGPGLGMGAGAGAGLGGLAGGLGGLLNSGGMGRIAQSVLGNKQGGFSWLKGALLAGAGSMLWSKLSDRMEEANKANPKYSREHRSFASAQSGTADQRAARAIRALVYAAKADGHIDETEKANINRQVDAMELGSEARTLVQAVMEEPIDPSRVAVGVADPQEALQLYTLSAAAIDPDQFMEKAYLDALGQALNIPDDVREQVLGQVQENRQGSLADAFRR